MLTRQGFCGSSALALTIFPFFKEHKELYRAYWTAVFMRLRTVARSGRSDAIATPNPVILTDSAAGQASNI
jgi:hypothetical protein